MDSVNFSPTREQQKDQFLNSIGKDEAVREFLAGDASFRKYDRVTDRRKHTYVLMDAPPEHEDITPFTSIARHLLQQGLSAPTIYGEDKTNGFLLLEDFGDISFTKLLGKEPQREQELYEAATDVLLHLHQSPLPRDVAPYSIAKYLDEALLLVDWFLVASCGKHLAEKSRTSFIALWQEALNQLPPLPTVLTLRDYHADNLLWRMEQKGLARVGLLDFQDALIGSPAYDLVSFLEDARRDVQATTIEHCLTYYAAHAQINEQDLRTHFSVLGAQRNSKIIGIFVRLTLRDNKPHYLSYLPRVWRWIEEDLQHPALHSIQQWFDHYIPKNMRGLPSEPELRQRFYSESAA